VCNKNGTFYALRTTDLDAGPVWGLTVGGGPSGYEYGDACIAPAIFDGHHLYIQGPSVEIGSQQYPASVEEVNPATGSILWQTPLEAYTSGAPSLDGAGLLAATSWGNGTDAPDGTTLLNSTNGDVLARINGGAGQEFAQPVFADGYLLLATTTSLTAYKPGA
jgi:hypothetical protein